MQIGQIIDAETMILIGILLLGVIAVSLLILIGMVKKLISLNSEMNVARSVNEKRLLPELDSKIPEEDLAVIMALMTKMLPGVSFADMKIKRVHG